MVFCSRVFCLAWRFVSQQRNTPPGDLAPCLAVFRLLWTIYASQVRHIAAPHVPPEPRRSVVAYPAGASTGRNCVASCAFDHAPYWLASLGALGGTSQYWRGWTPHLPALRCLTGCLRHPSSGRTPCGGTSSGPPERSAPGHPLKPPARHPSFFCLRFARQKNPGARSLGLRSFHSLAGFAGVQGGAREQAPWGRFRFAAPHSTAGRWGALWSLGAPASNGSRVTSPRARWAAAGRHAPFSWRRMDPLTRLSGRQCLPDIAAASP